jgi:adenylate kinase
MDAGDYVPDEVTNAMVRSRLAEPDARGGFLLDGYPRTVAQVEELDAMLADAGEDLDAVVVLSVDRDEVVARLLKRAETEGRADDTEDVIRRRQEVYAEQTAPLLEVYAGRGLLVEVDGLGSVDEVSSRVFAALDADGAATAR